MGMSTKTQSELSKFFGPVVATGAERICCLVLEKVDS